MAAVRALVKERDVMFAVPATVRSWVGAAVPMPTIPKGELAVEKESRGTFEVEVAKEKAFMRLFGMVEVEEIP